VTRLTRLAMDASAACSVATGGFSVPILLLSPCKSRSPPPALWQCSLKTLLWELSVVFSDLSVMNIIPNSISVKLWSFDLNFSSSFSRQIILTQFQQAGYRTCYKCTAWQHVVASQSGVS